MADISALIAGDEVYVDCWSRVDGIPRNRKWMRRTKVKRIIGKFAWIAGMPFERSGGVHRSDKCFVYAIPKSPSVDIEYAEYKAAEAEQERFLLEEIGKAQAARHRIVTKAAEAIAGLNAKQLAETIGGDLLLEIAERLGIDESDSD